MSPGESLSRAVMFRLNLPRPDLQVKVLDDDANGTNGFNQESWPQYRRFLATVRLSY